MAPDEVVDAALAALPQRASSLTPVLNATGIVVHTNLGRAPLAPAAVDAVTENAIATGIRPTSARSSNCTSSLMIAR